MAAEATDRSDESLKPEVQELIAQGEKVVAFGNDRVQFRPGGLYDGWWIHVWTLREGRVVALREYFDTAMAVELCRAAG